MRFPGGKGRLYPRLINLIPPHQVFIEPFAGGAAVLRHKRPAPMSVAVDRDIRVLLRLASLRLPHCKIVCADGVTFLQDYPFQGCEFLYCDPPYLPSTRRSRRTYRYELELKQHIQLLTTLKQVPCRVLISGYPSTHYSKMLKDWNFETFPARTHAGWATEGVWYNYPSPSVLHDGRYLGDDYRQRHTIRRRLARHRRRLSSLPPQERAEIYKWLAENLGEDIYNESRTSYYR